MGPGCVSPQRLLPAGLRGQVGMRGSVLLQGCPQPGVRSTSWVEAGRTAAARGPAGRRRPLVCVLPAGPLASGLGRWGKGGGHEQTFMGAGDVEGCLGSLLNATQSLSFVSPPVGVSASGRRCLGRNHGRPGGGTVPLNNNGVTRWAPAPAGGQGCSPGVNSLK